LVLNSKFDLGSQQISNWIIWMATRPVVDDGDADEVKGLDDAIDEDADLTPPTLGRQRSLSADSKVASHFIPSVAISKPTALHFHPFRFVSFRFAQRAATSLSGVESAVWTITYFD
jgi:hypothetical protein